MYETSPWAVAIFVGFVAFVLWISFFFARKAKSAKGYFAAGGNIHWAVNGIAFAGDYLSAASFLGICGMIAVYGYDGFLYSIGYLAGWIVALFVVAEPMKRLGKFTFTDALDSKFNSKGIQLMAALSTLVVSMFYLIPQMVGAGVLVTPLLGLPHWIGVTMVGGIVIFIVATAGMASTTYVQFLKGALLIVFSIVLVIVVFNKGLSTSPQRDEDPYPKFMTLPVTVGADGLPMPTLAGKVPFKALGVATSGTGEKAQTFVKLQIADGDETKISWWQLTTEEGQTVLKECCWQTTLATPVKDSKGQDASILYGGRRSDNEKVPGQKPKSDSKPLQAGHISKLVHEGRRESRIRPGGNRQFPRDDQGKHDHPVPEDGRCRWRGQGDGVLSCYHGGA